MPVILFFHDSAKLSSPFTPPPWHPGVLLAKHAEGFAGHGDAFAEDEGAFGGLFQLEYSLCRESHFQWPTKGQGGRKMQLKEFITETLVGMMEPGGR